MKKLFASLTFIALLSGAQAFAQTKTGTTPATTPTKGSTTTTATTSSSSASSASALTPKAKMLCHTWQPKTIEAWAVEHDASDAEKADLFYLGEDGNARFIWGGVANSGKWTIDKSNTWMKITTNDGQTINIKVTSVTDSELKIDYKDKDDQHNIVTYTVVQTTSGQR